MLNYIKNPKNSKMLLTFNNIRTFKSLYPKGLNKKNPPRKVDLGCDPPGARTQDPNIKSVVLYLLS